MPQFWLAIFFIVIAIAQLFQSIKEINLPFPVYLVLGTSLAVASNYQGKLLFSQDLPQAIPEPQVAVQTKEPPVLNSVPAEILTATDDLIN